MIDMLRGEEEKEGDGKKGNHGVLLGDMWEVGR